MLQRMHFQICGSNAKQMEHRRHKAQQLASLSLERRQ